MNGYAALKENVEEVAGQVTGGDPKFVTALARGLSILRCFRSTEVALSNHILASRTGLPRPTVTRLTYTLCQLGYLVQTGQTGEYRLGAGVLSLGFGVLAAMDLKDRADVELAEICAGDNPNVAAALGERHGISAVYLATHRSPHSVSMPFHVGARLPLFNSAMGRAILVAMPEEDADRLLDRACSEANEEARTRLRSGLEKARADYAQMGYCTSFGEWRKEVNGIATPVVIAQTGRIYGLTVGGLAFLNPESDLQEIYAPRMIEAARNLSLEAG